MIVGGRPLGARLGVREVWESKLGLEGMEKGDGASWDEKWRLDADGETDEGSGRSSPSASLPECQ